MRYGYVLAAALSAELSAETTGTVVEEREEANYCVLYKMCRPRAAAARASTTTAHSRLIPTPGPQTPKGF